MKKQILKFCAVLALALGLVMPAAVSVPAYAQTTDDVQRGVDFTCPGGNCGGNAETEVGNIISTVINVLSIVVGVVAVIMVIIGGLKYIISSGDSGNVQSAKNTILYAIVGLVIVAFAQIIVRFVLDQV
ncbi:MAG: hypothetical protein U5L95_02000 [Candidatus Saccharibacteria bacterium]|nr:hypothetical protein [Candidatus Saccharibacteria bacterium]